MPVFERLNFNMNRVYPTLVVSTMSSGKSTLINSLVGAELLPSSNRACTAKSIAILDNDQKTRFGIHSIDKEGKYSFIEENTEKVLEQFNGSDELSEVIIEGQIRGIKNSKKSLLVVDTPGINNSMDTSHEQVTKNTIDEYPEGLILYIINAQQIGTYDDSYFLSFIAQKLKDNPKFNIIFVINKMDLVDPEKEKPYELINNCKKYIEAKGISDPVLIPTSASSALIFKKVLSGFELSELEEENFIRDYRRFKGNQYSLTNFAYISERGDMESVLEIDGLKYTRAEIYAALYNTGIPMLENVIDEMLVKSLKMRAPQITCNKVKKNIKPKEKTKASSQKTTGRKKKEVQKRRKKSNIRGRKK